MSSNSLTFKGLQQRKSPETQSFSSPMLSLYLYIERERALGAM